MMKTAAIVGSRSMLGAKLASLLRARSVEVISIGRSPDDDILADLGLVPAIMPEIDLAADALFHCAASFCGDDPVGHRQNLSVNGGSAGLVSEIAQKLGAKALVYAGSAFSDKNAQENYGSYGFTKHLAEQAFAALGPDIGFRFVSLRFSQFYDTEGRCCARQPWFGRIIAYASRGLDLRMPASLSTRNFMHVEDAAEAMIRAAEESVHGIIPISHPENLTSDELAALAYDTFAAGGHPIIVPEKAPFRAFRFQDGAESLTALALRPRSTRAGLGGIRDAGTAEAFGPMDVN